MVSFYRVIQMGDLSREERLNLGVLCYEEGEDAAVLCQFTGDLKRIAQTFNLSEDIIGVTIDIITLIKTKKDLDKCVMRMGPYSSFELTDPRPSTALAPELLEQVAQHFLRK